ncbi:MAG: caspase family protein [Muribaculaceae bacterium]|nr:caspase family protein [Muribaculaceae bacterium]
MRKLLLLLICTLWQLSPMVSMAQTFHAIIFANTENKGIGASVGVDFKRMELEMTTIAKSIGYSLKKYNYYGSPNNFNRENLDKVLNSLNCSPNDIVYFYYSGHGGRAENESTKFPEMCLFVNDENFNSRSQLYPLYDVYTRIRKKNPRLTIVMGDMCNSIIQGYYKNENPASKGATILSKGTADVYKNLFLNTKGGLIAASSEPGHTSGCYVFKEDGKYYHAGGYLTHSFLTVLQHFVTNSENVNWESLMNNTIAVTRKLTEDNTDDLGRPSPQVPIYKPEIEVVSSTATNTNLNTVPQQPTPSNDTATNQQDNLAYSLSMVANQSVPKLDRIRNIKNAKGHFADMQSKVQVVGCDNRTIVNTSNIEYRKLSELS